MRLTFRKGYAYSVKTIFFMNEPLTFCARLKSSLLYETWVSLLNIPSELDVHDAENELLRLRSECSVRLKLIYMA